MCGETPDRSGNARIGRGVWELPIQTSPSTESLDRRTRMTASSHNPFAPSRRSRTGSASIVLALLLAAPAALSAQGWIEPRPDFEPLPGRPLALGTWSVE